MLTLAIEASNPSIAPRAGCCAPGIALGHVTARREVRVLGVEPINPASRHDDDLTAAIARLHERLGIAPRSIERIAVSVGPGGYTSLRMACATAQMIALAAGDRARCIAVPTAAVALCTLRAGLPRAPVAVALAGKADAAWVTVWASPDADPATPSHPGRLMTAADVSALRAGTFIADEHVPEAIRRATSDAGMNLVPTALDASALLHAAAVFPDIEPSACVPLYGREPEAVTKWRALHGAPST